MATDVQTTDKRQVPPDVRERIRRASEQIDGHRAQVEECMAFWRGDHYVYVNADKRLVHQATVTSVDGSGKPPHRVRNTWNLIRGVVEGKVSAATQRVPAYDISPSTTDPEDAGAARLAGQVALYGYDRWRLRRATKKVVTHALVGREGFAQPYFDPDVAPYVPIVTPDGEVKTVGTGEIKIKTYGPNEVGWEPGVDFEDSPWFVCRQARDPKSTASAYNYRGTLTPDAQTSDEIGDDRSKARPKLVMVSEYYERPSLSNPQGRRLVIANDTILADEEYPARDGEGNIVDEPVLHRLSYTVDPDADRDLGLVDQLLDPQRTFNDSHSKVSEWKNRALNPQMKAPIGSLKGRRTDEPGVINYYQPIGGKEPEWEKVPQIPGELFQLIDLSREILYDIAAVGDPPDNIEAARARAAEIEQAQQRWQSFIGDLAEWHSRVMRHCLSLVARHYTEPRMLKIKGRFGPEQVSDFRGADLRDQIDVTVLPGSIEPRTRQAIIQQIQWIATVFPGYLTPEAALAAINGGTAEKLIESYELDVARAHQVIQKLKAGPEVFLAEAGNPDRPPSWMPRPFDNLAVHKAIFADWMKTSDYDLAAEPVKEAADLYWRGLEYLEAQRAAQQAAMQNAIAAQQGMTNAAAPQTKGMPSLPGVTGDGGPDAPQQAPA